MKTKFTVKLSAVGCGSQVKPVASVLAARQAVSKFIDGNQLGASQLTRDCGLVRENGVKIGHVSYNGRFWPVGESR